MKKNKKFIKKNLFYSKKPINQKEIRRNNYLYRNRTLNKGVFLKKPSLDGILYPIFFNLRLVREYLKKK